MPLIDYLSMLGLVDMIHGCPQSLTPLSFVNCWSYSRV